MHGSPIPLVPRLLTAADAQSSGHQSYMQSRPLLQRHVQSYIGDKPAPDAMANGSPLESLTLAEPRLEQSSSGAAAGYNNVQGVPSIGAS